jgi:hypothetical protein
LDIAVTLETSDTISCSEVGAMVVAVKF